MLLYCLKFRKKKKIKLKSNIFQKKTPKEKCIYQTVLFAIVQNQHLSNSKKLAGY